ILAEHVASGVDVPALGVIRVGTLLTFYRHERLDSVLRFERDVLQAYDRMLESESERDAGFAALVRSREQAAERIVRSTPDQVDSWSDRYIRRLVSEGDSNAIVGLQDSVG